MLVPMYAVKIDEDAYPIVVAVMGSQIMAEKKSTILGQFCVMNEVDVCPFGTITLKNRLYSEEEFWEQFEMVNPGVDNAETDFFDVVYIDQ